MRTFGPMPLGVLATSITPFDRRGAVDVGAMRAHVDWVARSGCMGINVAGAGFGEGTLMTDSEVRAIYESTVSVGKSSIWCSASNLEHALATRCIDWARMASDAGMDMIRIYPCTLGHGIQPTREMLESYYDTILSAVDFIPVMISNNIITGFEVPVDIHARLLGNFPQIIAFSKIHHHVENFADFTLKMASTLPVFTTRVSHFVAGMLLGNVGWHTPLANLVPHLCSRFYDACRDGVSARAREYFTILHRLELTLSQHSDTSSACSIYKEVGRQLGLPTGRPRRPYLEVTSTTIKRSLSTLLSELEIRRYEGLV